MVFAWIGILAVALAVLIAASVRTVSHAEALLFGTRLPPFFVGVTLMSVGTDFPEIANSIAASVAGHGDINVGDSTGSAVTQATLVLGLLPWLAGPLSVSRKRVAVTCGACLLGLAIGTWFVADSYLSRSDGLIWVSAWILGSFIIWKGSGQLSEPALPVAAKEPVMHALALLAWLGVVTAAAMVAVVAFVEVSTRVGVPEYLLTFFAASIGTSLPELFVDITAIRKGLNDLALGDILGSSFVDATLSVGIGPLIAPTVIDGTLAFRGAIVALAAIAAVTLILVSRREHDRWSGLALLMVYSGVYIALLR